MNNYTLRYTVWTRTGNPVHELYNFESEYDLLVAADHGMCKIYDDYADTDTSLLFRSIELTNAKEVYERITREEAANVQGN